ncbi:MAG: nucleoside 2-deoxyribosyltransferase [Nanoarchaeota archaeon]
MNGNNEKTKIYFAASLFSMREISFNLELANELEKKYNVFLPQRDGFEFNKLSDKLNGKLPPEELSQAVNTIIYIFDIGYNLPKSDIIVANLDEPIDSGVNVEICYSALMGLPVVAFRTDVRSPYGQLTDKTGGIHPFLPFQCKTFIKYTEDSNNKIKSLSKKIAESIENMNIQYQKKLPDYVLSNPNIRPIFKASDILFGNGNARSLESISDLYIKNKSLLQNLFPRII